MKRPSLNRIVGEIKCNSVYYCSYCTNSSVGTTSRFTLDAYGLQDVIDQLSSIRQSPHDMPYGWAHNGNGNYQCVRCLA